MKQVEMERVMHLIDEDIVGKTFKNFTDFSKFLGIEVIPSGSQRVKFMNLLNENFEVTKDGNKLIFGQRKIVAKKPFGLDKDAEVYKAVGRMFYSYLDTLGINRVHYIKNVEFAIGFNLINQTYDEVNANLPMDITQFHNAMKLCLETDYSVLINDLIKTKIRSIKERDIFNQIEEVWMCNGVKVEPEEIKKKILNWKKDYILEKYGAIIMEEDESGKVKQNKNRITIKANPELTWGESPQEVIYSYLPRDAEKKAIMALNKEREEQGLFPYYKAWEIIYVENPYDITLNGEKNIVNEKRMELVNNRMKFNQYDGMWKTVYGLVRTSWEDWIKSQPGEKFKVNKYEYTMLKQMFDSKGIATI